MKKLSILCSLLLLLTTLALGQTTIPYVFYNNTAFGATGTSVTINNTNSGAAWHQVTWTVVGGTFTACSFKIDSSTDGSIWNDGDILGATNCALNGQSATINFVADYSRVRLTTYTVNTGTPILKTIYVGFINNPATATQLSGVTFAWVNPQKNDHVVLSSAVTGTNAVVSLPMSTAHTGHEGDASITYSCATDGTGDANSVILRNNAGAMTDTLPVVSGTCPPGTTLFVHNASAAGTITLGTGSTAKILAGVWAKLHANTSTWDVFEEFSPDSNGKIPYTLLAPATATTAGAVPTPPNDNTKAFCGDATWGTTCAGSGAGTIVASPQYQLPFYSAAGTATTLTGTASFVTNATGQFGVQLGAGVLTDVAMMKFGALAANQNNGNGKPIVAVAHTINDTNFPSIQYVFGYEDDDVVSISNAGANNTGYVAFRAAPRGAVAGTVLANGIVGFQDEIWWGSALAPSFIYGFYSQPTNNGTVGSGTRKALVIWDILGNKVNNNYGIHINNMTNGNNNYAYVDDCNGCRSYISNSLSVGSQQNSFADTNDSLTVFGHLGLEPKAALAANKPTVATNDCGSTSQGTVSGADSAGIITVGTATVTSCAITFKTSFPTAPSCTVNLSVTGITLGVTTSTTKLTVASSGNIDGDKIYYHCINVAAN